MRKIITTIIILFLLMSCKSDKANQFYEKAQEFEKQEKYEEAINYLSKAIKINPKFHQAYLDRSIDKLMIRDFEGALSDVENLISVRPKGVGLYVWRAECKRMLEKYEEALLDIEIALKLKNPIISDSLKNGEIQLIKDDQINLKPDYDIDLVEILYERASSNFMLGNDDSAYKDLNYCISRNFSIKECKWMRGILYLNSGNNELGCKDLLDSEKIEKGFAAKEIAQYCK